MHRGIVVSLVVGIAWAILFVVMLAVERPTPNEEVTTNAKAVKPIYTTDYFFAGGGSSGLRGASDTVNSIWFYKNDTSVPAKKRNINPTLWIVEKNNYWGGNVKDIKLRAPAGYTGPELRLGLGALRDNQLTVPRQRQAKAYYNITVHYSPFRNDITGRGQRALCGNPLKRHRPDDPYSGGNICTANENMSDAFPDLGWVTSPDNPDYPNVDPSYSLYLWLLEYGGPNPYTGLACGDGPDQRRCPKTACKNYRDFFSFLAGELSMDYAEFFLIDFTGFFGDNLAGTDACIYIDYNTREWDTAGTCGYPEGGMSELMIRMHQRIVSYPHATAKLNTNIVRIDKCAANSKCMYTVETNNEVIQVTKKLVLALTPSDIKEIGGDVPAALSTAPQFNAIKDFAVFAVNVQWDPNNRNPWFKNLTTEDGENFYSFRTFGDKSCISRLEFISTPYTRTHNAARIVYNDYRCMQIWLDYYTLWNANQKQSMLDMINLQLSILFPNHYNATIHAPLIGDIHPHYWPHAWHEGNPAMLKRFSANDVRTWALSAMPNLFITATAFNPRYIGWTEGGYDLSDASIKTFDDGGDYVGQPFDGFLNYRANLFPETAFAQMPSPFPNEVWWPTAGQCFDEGSNAWSPCV